MSGAFYVSGPVLHRHRLVNIAPCEFSCVLKQASATRVMTGLGVVRSVSFCHCGQTIVLQAPCGLPSRSSQCIFPYQTKLEEFSYEPTFMDSGPTTSR